MNQITQKTALDLGKMIKAREISVTEAITQQLKIIRQRDKDYNSYISIIEDEAISQGKTVQEKIDKGELDHSPLAGVPIAIKDNICIKEGKTTAGSRMLSNYKSTYDATVVKKLKDAGAIIIGKTNMDEFSIGDSTETSYYGATKNPWNTDYSPGGSSGGSAAAVAAEEVFYSLGSDTGGSIRQPAGYCGVVGIKPTYGTVSRFGLIPSASSLEQIGVFGRNISDAVAALDIIAGHDSKDSTSLEDSKYNFSKALDDDLRGMKIGIPKIYLGEGLEEAVYDNIMKVAKTFAEMGAVVNVFDLPHLQYASPAYYAIASGEISSNLARYDGIRFGYRTKKLENLEDMYINTRNEGFGLEVKKYILLGNMILGSGNYDVYYNKAQKVRTAIINSFDSAFEEYDIIMGPTSPDTAPHIGVNQENPLKKHLSDIYLVPVNLAGLPALSLPSGRDKKGLPIGLQLIGKPHGERDIIKAAYNFEQVRGYKRPTSIQ